MTAAALCAAVDRLLAQAEDQGLPLHVADPIVLDRVAAIVRAHEGGDRRA